MAWVVKKYSKKTGRGKLRRFEVHRVIECEGGFDLPYERAVHRRFVLGEVNGLLGSYRSRYPGSVAYRLKQATRWRDAILRDAALLRGFFDEEPALRNKVLRWCEKTVAKLSRVAK